MIPQLDISGRISGMWRSADFRIAPQLSPRVLGFPLAFYLFATVGPPAVADSGAFAGMMRPGMILRGLVYPLNPLSPDKSQVLRAAEVEILEPTHLLRIKDLRLTGGRQSGGFNLDAPAAVFDLKTKAIHAGNGFRAVGLGLHFAGAALSAELKSQSYQVGGRFEIQLSGLQPSVPLPNNMMEDRRSPFLPQASRPNGLASAEAMTSVGLVQDFAGNLATFLDCWKWVEARDGNRFTGTFMLMGHQGGEIDLERMEMRLDGRSAILGPRSVLVSSGGMRLCRETLNGEDLIRMTGNGGVRTWIHPPKADETWIQSASFECVSDRRILQFEGGPLTIGRKGMILEASENWQFVRVFDGGRIVLSPGSWNMLGTMSAFTD